MVHEKGSRERCNSWTVLHAQGTNVLCSGFPVSQGNAEASDRWGGKTKHRLISYFLSNNSAKIYHNRMVYVKIITSQRWDVFWDTVYKFIASEVTTVRLRRIWHIFQEKYAVGPIRRRILTGRQTRHFFPPASGDKVSSGYEDSLRRVYTSPACAAADAIIFRNIPRRSRSAPRSWQLSVRCDV